MELTSKIPVDTTDVKAALELIEKFNFEVDKSNHLLREQIDLLRKTFETTKKYNGICQRDAP